MNPLAIAVYAAVVVTLLRQFGTRMSPGRSLSWWLIFLFLGVAVVRAETYEALAAALGFKLISNFVFAALLFLTLFELVEQTAFSTKTSRQMRRLVSADAARSLPALVGKKPEILVVVPCYNEEKALQATIPRLAAAAAKLGGAAQICFVDDGSRDATWRVLTEQTAGIPYVTAARHLVNIGVGGVLLTGFTVQRDLGIDYVVQCDGDGQHPEGEIARLVAQARANGCDLLIGSRFAAVDGATDRDGSSTRARRAGGLLIQAVLGLFGKKAMVNDPTSGFRVFSRRFGAYMLDRMPDEYPEPESVALAVLAGFKVGEARVAMAPRVAGESSIGRMASVRYMYKVVTALVGLRLRSISA